MRKTVELLFPRVLVGTSVTYFVISSGNCWNKQLLQQPTRDCCVPFISRLPLEHVTNRSQIGWNACYFISNLVHRFHFALYLWHFFNMCIFLILLSCQIRFNLFQKENNFKTLVEDKRREFNFHSVNTKSVYSKNHFFQGRKILPPPPLILHLSFV